MVHDGREPLSEAGRFHSLPGDEEPLFLRDLVESHGLKSSGLSVYMPLMRPAINVPHLEKAIRFAHALGALVANTDERIRPPWLDDEGMWRVMRRTLKTVPPVAERYGVFLAIEPHQSISKTTEGLLRIATLVDSPMLRINYDTGNAFLAGEDPYAGLDAVGELVVHVHAKDISIQHAEAEQGKVTGTPAGCACGDGLIDWRRVVAILKKHGYDGVLSVECGTPAPAARSLAHLNGVISSA